MTFLKALAVLIRIVTEIVLLGFAWQRSDWSVAAMLTLLTATMEYRAFRARIRAAREQDESERFRRIAEINRMQG